MGDRGEHLLAPHQNIVVPEADYTKTLLLKPLSPALIVRDLIDMLRAVCFNYQLGLGTVEVGDVGSQPDLPAELGACKTPAPQRGPKKPLRRRRKASHVSDAIQRL